MSNQRSLAEAEALFNQLCAEFSAPQPPKAKQPREARPAKPEWNDAERERHLIAQAKKWKPVAIVYHLHEQHCQCCGERTEILGSSFIRHENAQIKATWECPRSTLQQVEYLPHEFVTHSETVERCPRCLRLENVVCDYPMREAHQLPLLTH